MMTRAILRMLRRWALWRELRERDSTMPPLWRVLACVAEMLAGDWRPPSRA